MNDGMMFTARLMSVASSYGGGFSWPGCGAGAVLMGCRTRFGDRVFDRIVNRNDRVEPETPEERPQRRRGGHHEPQLTAAGPEVLGQVVEETNRGAVEVGHIVDVHGEQLARA